MKKVFIGPYVMVIILLVHTAVYVFASNTDPVPDELKKLGIQVTGPAVDVQAQLPTEFLDANWGLKNMVCQQGGYDLSMFSGKKVRLTRFPIDEKYETELLDVWVISSDDNIACVYKTVRDGSNSAPGIFPVVKQ